MADEGMITQRFNSEAFSGPDRIEAFREIYGRQMMKLQMDPLPGHPFGLDFLVQGFADFGYASGWLTPTRNTHTAEMIEDDDLIIVLSPQGHGSLQQIGREVTIENGQATLLSNGEPGVFYGHVPSHLVSFRLSRKLLSPLVPNLEDALVRQIPRDNPSLQLMTSYARVMTDMNALATPELRRAIAVHMHDLAALTIGAERDVNEITKQRGVRAARLRAIKDDITANLSQQRLSADTLAARHGISPRYVNMLFETEGVSISEFVLMQRLALAHRKLSDPGMAERSISAIAYDVGFRDLSYFNRTFRRRYNATPSDIRAAIR